MDKGIAQLRFFGAGRLGELPVCDWWAFIADCDACTVQTAAHLARINQLIAASQQGEINGRREESNELAAARGCGAPARIGWDAG
jgi:hypothetical protein